ncbi:Hypothetical Protein OBI_RACECAR_284 [Arthrobacter phage Racecar]|nr:hypothetical protein PBI_RACECAR_76 [Arthrobacter phage Racecar]
MVIEIYGDSKCIGRKEMNMSIVNGDRVKRISSGETGVVKDADIGSFAKYSNVVFDGTEERALCLTSDLEKVGESKFKRGDKVYWTGTGEHGMAVDDQIGKTVRVRWGMGNRQYTVDSFVGGMKLMEEVAPKRLYKRGDRIAINGSGEVTACVVEDQGATSKSISVRWEDDGKPGNVWEEKIHLLEEATGAVTSRMNALDATEAYLKELTDKRDKLNEEIEQVEDMLVLLTKKK